MDLTLSAPLLGALHTLACLVALPVGAWLLVARKGTRRHRFWGDVFAAAMLFAGASSLFIYSRGFFSAAHGFAIAAIVLTGAGFALSRWKRPDPAWRYAHIVCMVGSYYVLIGGLVNEVFLRTPVLRPIMFGQPELFGMIHGLVMLAFMCLIAAFLTATGVSRARGAAGA